MVMVLPGWFLNTCGYNLEVNQLGDLTTEASRWGLDSKIGDGEWRALTCRWDASTAQCECHGLLEIALVDH